MRLKIDCKEKITVETEAEKTVSEEGTEKKEEQETKKNDTEQINQKEKQKEEAGVYDDLIRVSVGIEDLGDLIEDFRQAIEMMEKQ